jgi:hypothetical protein
LTLESDTPTARYLSRQALSYKARLESAMHLLSLWNDRWLPDDDGTKGTFDDSEPGFSDLVDATDRFLHGDGEPTAKDICCEGLHIAPKSGSM